MLQVQGVHKCYVTAQGPLTVLAGVDLHLAQGGSLALMGESGSGKARCCTWWPAWIVSTAAVSAWVSSVWIR